MLKKSLNAAIKLEARAAKVGNKSLQGKSKLADKIRALQIDLESRAKEHDEAAKQARAAAKRLGELVNSKVAKVAPKKAASTTPKKAAGKPKTKTPKIKASQKVARRPVKEGPTLARAIEKVLSANQAKKSNGITARQLRTEVEKVGYVFAGAKLENQMNYLHKVLRSFGARIKRAANGNVSLQKG